jgi:hypothetical protein
MTCLHIGQDEGDWFGILSNAGLEKTILTLVLLFAGNKLKTWTSVTKFHGMFIFINYQENGLNTDL